MQEGAVTGTRDQPFGYACGHCGGCCHHLLVRVNAYEIARLAERLGKSTGDTETEYTVARPGMGRVLRQDARTGACVFWQSPGCAVHADRPLPCRLFPLNRDRGEDGIERWRMVGLPDGNKGDQTVTGTIGDFVGAADTERYIEAFDDYTAWTRWVMRRLSGPNAVQPLRPDRFADMLDMDTAIELHCAETGEAAPTDIEGRKRLHLDILYRQLPPEAGLG